MTCALWDQCSEICPRLQGVAKKEGMRGDFDVLHSAFAGRQVRHSKLFSQCKGNAECPTLNIEVEVCVDVKKKPLQAEA